MARPAPNIHVAVVEEVLLSVIRGFDLKFLGAMMKPRVMGERYYPPIGPDRLGSKMPEHLRVKFDLNVDGVKGIPGSLDAKGRFVPAKSGKSAPVAGKKPGKK